MFSHKSSEEPTGHEKKKSKKFFSNPPQKERVMTVMKDTYPKRNFKPHSMGLLKKFGFLIIQKFGTSE